MKDYKFELEDLDLKDKLNGLIISLIANKLITDEDLLNSFKAVLHLKNEQLEKELNDNPGAKLLFDMVNINKK